MTSGTINGHLNAEDIKRKAAGRCSHILQTVCGLTDHQVNPKVHGPCPDCGGTDRFRAFDDVNETGGLLCNQCGKRSDVFASVQWLRNCTFSEALKLVADEIGHNGNGHHKPASQRKVELQNCNSTIPVKPKKVHATSEQAAEAFAWGLMQSGILQEKRKPDEGWRYRHADGTDAFSVVRWNLPDGTKTFGQITKVDGGWICGGMPEPRPLYRLPDIIDAAEVWICEGEKACDAAVLLGLQATTSAGGSNAAEKSDWTPLAGKRVYILPDNDDPGEKFTREVVELIGKQAPNATIEVKRLKEDWPAIPDGGDVFDWSEQFDSADAETLRARLHSISNSLSEFVGDCPVNPEEKRPFADKADEFTPFPVDELPPVLANFCREVSAAVGCDESFPAMVCLAVCAAAIGTSRQLCIKYGWFVPPILWTILVGESGTQKSPPFRMAMAPLKDKQQRDIDSFMAADSQYREDLKAYKLASKTRGSKPDGDSPEPKQPNRPIRKRCIVQDSTIEALAPILNENPRGVLLARDELSGWLAGFDKYSNKASASSEVPKWLEIYNSESITIDRKTGDERFIFVRKPSVAICGGIQPGILSRCLTSEHKENGLQSRLLMTFPPRQAKQWRDDELSPATQSAYGDCIRDLFEFQGDESTGECKPATLKLSQSARALFKSYVNETGQEQAAMHGHLASQWSKLEETPARLAIILHCVRQVTTGVVDHWHVDELTMQSAINLGEWFKNETLRIGRTLVEPEDVREARHLATWIQSQGGRITARDLCKLRRDIVNSDNAESKLIGLVELGFGSWHGIHKSREFVLNQ